MVERLPVKLIKCLAMQAGGIDPYVIKRLQCA
jgi:hypothetical protein